MDADGSGALDYAEFKQALLGGQLAFSEDQLRALFGYFDTDHSGAIEYEELLYGLRGQLSPKLLVLVHQIFDLLDRQGLDAIDPAALIAHFDASRHPEVQARARTPQEVQKEFLDTFDVGGVQPGMITREEFVRYYTNIAAAVNDDDYFETILRSVWHIAQEVSASALAGYKNQLSGVKTEPNSLANKLRMAQTMDAAVQRPASATATRRSFHATAPTAAAPAVPMFAPSSTARPTQPPVRPQSAGPMGRGRLNAQYRGAPPAVAAVSVEPVEFQFSGEVDEDKVLAQAKLLQRDAILCFNAQQYAAAEAKFADLLQVMRLLYPANHPECVKAEKSVLMVQRKQLDSSQRRPRSSAGYRY